MLVPRSLLRLVRCSCRLNYRFHSRSHIWVIGAGLFLATVAIFIWCLCRQVAYRRGFAIYPEAESQAHLFQDICSKNTFEVRENKSNLEEKQTTLKHYFMLTLVMSRPNATERRIAIRRSWIQGNRELCQKEKVLVLFSVGTANLPNDQMRNLINEQQKYGDLLILEDLEESYSNLSNKVLSSFVRIDAQYRYSYVLKCDDDSFVVLEWIVKTLKGRKSDQNYYWGKMIEDAQVFTDGKFAEKHWSLGKKYIPYAIGAGYVVSGNLVRLIARNSGSVMPYHNEDVSVSVWITPYDVQRQHSDGVCENKRFMYYKCAREAVVLHPVKSSQDMVQLQQLYSKRKARC